MNDKVSIIVPVYNAEKTIERCLKTILNQTYNNIEVILINDGSNDSSDKIIKSFDDKRIIYKKNKNQGVSKTRNDGIDLSSGKFIVFVDSDDYLSEFMIEKLMNKKDNFVVSGYNEVHKDVVINSFELSLSSDLIDIGEHFWDLYEVKKAVNRPWGKLYNASIIKNNCLKFNENLSLGEDLLFNLEYFRFVNKLVYIDEPLYFYRVGNPNSLAKKYYSNMLEIQIILKDKFLAYCESLNLDNSIKEKVYIKALRFLLSAVTNELHGKKNNKLFNMKKIIGSSAIQNYALDLYNNGYLNIMQYMIIKNKMIFTYILFRNIIFI